MKIPLRILSILLILSAFTLPAKAMSRLWRHPAPTPTPTATATPKPTPTPTPAPTPAPLRAPHGIIDLGNKGWTNPAVDGVRVRIAWTDVQPKSADAYDWSLLDTALAQAQTHGKLLGISVALLSDAPAWLTAKRYPLPATQSGHTRSIVLPWDPAAQPQILAFIKALGARYDGKVNYVAMGGLGAVVESYITPDPATIGLSMKEAVADWTASCHAIIAAYADAFHATPFIFTAAKPFQSADGASALQGVVDGAAAKYGARFGVMDSSLNAQSNTAYLPNALVQKYSKSHPVGLQFLTSSVGFGGHDLAGTVAQTLEAAAALGAHYVEVYSADADDPANADLLRAAAAKLLP